MSEELKACLACEGDGYDKWATGSPCSACEGTGKTEDKEEKRMGTLADGLQTELARNRELLVQYRSIGPNGAFGSAMIEQGIRTAEKAILENDLPAMIRAYKELQESE